MFWVPQDHLAPLVGMLKQAPNIVLGPSPSSTYRNTDASEVEVPAPCLVKSASRVSIAQQSEGGRVKSFAGVGG